MKSFSVFLSLALFMASPAVHSESSTDYCPYSKDGDRYEGKWAGLLRMVSSGGSGGDSTRKSKSKGGGASSGTQ